jgi:hypothetical protein
MEIFIYEKKNALSLELCKQIMDYFEENKEIQVKHTKLTCESINPIEKLTNRNNITQNAFIITIPSNITESNKCYELKTYLLNKIQEGLKEYYQHLGEDIFSFESVFNSAMIHNFIIKKYVKGEGFFSYHDDSLYDVFKQKYRMLSVIWYLNDVQEGGETEFFGNYSIRAEMGKMLLFPSDWFFPNSEKIPISEDKYIICAWIYIGIETDKNT